MKISRLNAPRSSVGEGPLWDCAEQTLYYIDIAGKTVTRYNPETEHSKTWRTPSVIGSMALRKGGGAILALQDGIYALNFASGDVSPHVLPHSPDPRVQFNDGKADRAGRFVVGTTDAKMRDYIGEIFSLGADRQLRVLDNGICISNGPCWSPDNRTFYFADSLAKNIYAYDYDLASGTIANRRVFANTEHLGGIPDGATVDADGLVWSAICEAGKLVAYRPTGEIERIIETPVMLPSSVMFGGAGLDRLFFTSIDPSVFGRARTPDDGCLFAIDGVGARGLPEPLYAG